MAASTRRALLCAAPAAALAGTSLPFIAGAHLAKAEPGSAWAAAMADYRAASAHVVAAGDLCAAAVEAADRMRPKHPDELTYRWRRWPHPEVYSRPLHGKGDIDGVYPDSQSHVPMIAQQREKALAALPGWLAAEHARDVAAGVPEAEAISEAAYAREGKALERLLQIAPPISAAWVETLQIIVDHSPEDVAEHVETLIASARKAGLQ